ncbi:MAG: PAS domain S-box protein [Bacteroidota bacterium]|nr:PAS domain S-box protein [Candidatus Kapabacteria bacterium]MDW8220895.1 PAS domain S-box protein [Bacteroidota bacterium]
MTRAEVQAFDALPFGIFALDKDYTVRMWNACLAQWTGLESSALIGTDIRLWFTHWRASDFRDALKAIWQTQELLNLDSLPSLIPSYRDGTSTQRLYASSARLYIAADGEHVALFVLQDITPQAQEIERVKASLLEIEEIWRNDTEIRILNEELEKRVAERTEELARLNAELTREVTIRKHAEEAFRQSEHLLSLIFDNAAVGLALLHQNGRYIKLNQTFCKMFGYTAEELLGKHFVSLYREEERARAMQRWHELIAGERDIVSGERYFHLHNGKELYIHFTTGRLTLPTGEIRVISTVTDVSDVKRAQEDMRLALKREQELNKLKQNFVAAVSHEFRTPLTIILSSSEILQAQQSLPLEKREKMHFQIERSVKRMTELLDEVVFIERSMRERTVPFPRPLHIARMVADIVREAEVFDAQKHDVIVEYYGFSGEPTEDNTDFVILADSGLVRPILSHLMSNAAKFSSGEMPIRIRIERTQKELWLSVQDKGIGIPASDQPHIYDLFFRGSNAGLTQGTGMGLHIVKRCVDACGGIITCDSRVGHGTTFRVRIPLA